MVIIGSIKKRRLMQLVIYILRGRRRPLSTNEVSEHLARSWEFTNRLLNEMARRRYIRKLRRGGFTYWKL